MNVLLGHNKTVHEFSAQMPFTKQQTNRQTDSYFIETMKICEDIVGFFFGGIVA